MDQNLKHQETNWSDLIQFTVNFMIENNLNDLTIGENISNENGVWGRLSVSFYKEPFTRASAFYLSQNWMRDRNGFSSSVLNILKNRDKKDIGAVNCIQINFTETEWNEVQIFVLTDSNGRKYFKSDFDRVLSIKLQKNGIKCWLYCNYNYFMKKKTHILWKGQFLCRECKIKFIIVVLKNDEKKNFLVSWNQIIEHVSPVIPPNKRITSEERKKLGYELKSKGTTNYIAERIKNGETCDEKKNQNLRKIVSEFNHRHQLDSIFMADAEASKNSYGWTLRQADENKISGYIQVINQNPFGIILQSDLQVKIWSLFREVYPVWHFDATGKVMANLPRQNQILLFTLLARGAFENGTEIRNRIPVADFLTTSYDSLSIELYLRKIIDNFKGYCYYKNPKIIVTDFSWASINALLAAFNNCKTIHYLNWSYKLIVEKKETLWNLIPVKVYLCSTHLLKNISDDFKKIFKKTYDNRLKTNFMLGFSLLQNSISLNEFNQVLIALYNIYNTKYKNDKLIDFLAFLKLKKSVQTIKWLNSVANAENYKYEKFSNDYFFPEQIISSYQQDSPFTEYFNEILKNEDTKILSDEKSITNKVRNGYFCPSIFNIIKKRLHIMPFWTGILIQNSFDEIKTRLSNNSIEAWFDHLKNDLLSVNKRINIKRRCYPNEIAGPLINVINMKFEQFRSEIETKFGRFDKSKTEPKDVEMWDFNDRKNKNQQQSSRKKSHFQDDISKITLEDKYDDSFEVFTLPDEEEDVTTLDEKMDTKSIYTFEDVFDKETNVENFFNYKINNMLIRKKDSNRLLNNEWLSEHILEAYAHCLFQKSQEDILHLNCFHSTEIFNTGCIKVEIDYEFEKYKKIFGFINENRIHWTCFMVDLSELAIYYMDPMGERDENLIKFLKNWTKFSESIPFLSKKKWHLKKISHPKQRDSFNCGVYVCKFLKLILEKKRELQFKDSLEDLKEFREEINTTFKQYSIENFCSFCGSALKLGEVTFQTDCFHRYHSECPELKLKSKLNFFCPLCF